MLRVVTHYVAALGGVVVDCGATVLFDDVVDIVE